ncbi:MAG: glycerol kinase, partial [Tolumonas sp.]|nr:glycerol kinase [Tolumonas sp.]
GTTVVRPKLIETTALGAAFLAGLAVGFWESTAELSDKFSIDREFEPALPAEQREQLYSGWQKAVTRSQHWVD